MPVIPQSASHGSHCHSLSLAATLCGADATPTLPRRISTKRQCPLRLGRRSRPQGDWTRARGWSRRQAPTQAPGPTRLSPRRRPRLQVSTDRPAGSQEGIICPESAKGYDVHVTACSVSGRQHQQSRVSLCRAILKDPTGSIARSTEQVVVVVPAKLACIHPSMHAHHPAAKARETRGASTGRPCAGVEQGQK
ncbi:hypothetical protein F4780DRAFT_765927 [Xylariomycetidae sp. FL0641]|nr:hypothetical protein F4780DRAFT_765927 [Xylariomycetidae sp. FL0641]